MPDAEPARGDAGPIQACPHSLKARATGACQGWSCGMKSGAMPRVEMPGLKGGDGAEMNYNFHGQHTRSR